MTSPETAASPGSTNPVGLWCANGLEAPGRSHTAMDIRRMEIGHATALTAEPTRVAPTDDPNKADVSPAMLTAIPAARSNHGAFLLPDSIAVPPTTRKRSKRSAIG